MKIVCLSLAAAVVASVFSVVLAAPASAAGDCSVRNPPFSDYDSSEIKVNVPTGDPDIGVVPIRRGFYCRPDAAVGNEVLEASQGFGFGYDKARNRHNITTQTAMVFVLQSPYNFETTNDLGTGWNFIAYAREKQCSPPGQNCQFLQEQKVVAGTSEANVDEYYDMPAGDPVGLLTVYCDYGVPTRLRCDPWVTRALSNGEE